MLTLGGTDLIVIAVMMAAAFAGGYALLLTRLRAMLTDRQMKIADQMAALDNAIRALETRLAKHQAQTPLEQPSSANVDSTRDLDSSELRSQVEEITPEIQAAVAAAAIAAVGPNSVVHSGKPVTSPWTQQGRVLVQGGHNLRVQR